MRKLHLYKIYTPRDVAKFILREERDIINLLEKERKSGKFGRKIMGFWYVRGKEVIEIQKLMKGGKKDVKAKAGGSVVGRKNGRRIKKK